MTNQDTSGFTLLEVLIALVILGFAMLGTQAWITDRLVGSVGRQDHAATANQLAGDRLQAIETDPEYSELPARYTATNETIDGFPGFVRSTAFDEASSHLTVTVQVVTPSRADTVARTIVVGAP